MLLKENLCADEDRNMDDVEDVKLLTAKDLQHYDEEEIDVIELGWCCSSTVTLNVSTIPVRELFQLLDYSKPSDYRHATILCQWNYVTIACATK